MSEEVAALHLLVPAFLVELAKNALPVPGEIAADRVLCAFGSIRIKSPSAYASKTLAIAKPFMVPRDKEFDGAPSLAKHLVYQLLVEFKLAHHSTMRHVTAVDKRVDVASLEIFKRLAQVL